MTTKKELIDFLEWCRMHTTRGLFEGIDLAISNYTKSINSEAGNETPTVTYNEDKKKSCLFCAYRNDPVLCDHDPPCRTTDYPFFKAR